MTATGNAAPGRTVISPRYYLADALFLVGLEGQDSAMLEHLQAALRAPVWPLALGRKSFPPGEPVWLKEGIRPDGLRQALLAWPSLVQAARPNAGSRRLLLEHPSEGAVRLDQPIAPFAARRFGPRHVVTEVIDVPF
jgi:CRISPR system Cascade subunit CasD